MEKTTVVRVTKAMKFEALTAVLNGEAIPHGLTTADLHEFIAHERDLLTRKNSGEKKPTKTAQEHEALMEKVLSAMRAEGGQHTVTEWQGIVPEIALSAGVSNQKASRVLNDLEKSGKVIKEPDKRKMTFRAV